MPVPTNAVSGCRTSHHRLLETLTGLTDEVARGPSRLPDWTVGHVLTHLARNADSVVRRLEGAARREVVDQYPGGAAGRAADIEAGAGRPAAELVDDVRTSAAAVEAAYDAMPAEAWGNLTRAVSGEEQPATQVALSRWREVEFHHVDLGLGYWPEDWPTELVEACLPAALDGLARRADRAEVLAWIVGRGPAPELTPWG